MRIRPVIFILLLTCSFSMLLSTAFGGASGQVLLVDDTTVRGDESDSDDYEFAVLSENPAVIGVRPLSGNGYDIEIFNNTSYEELIKSSESTRGAVNFIVLDGESWTSPPNLGAQMSSNSGDYIIEMENEADKHPTGISWVGSMDIPLGGPVLNYGFPGSLDDEGVYGSSVVFEDEKYHMWYTLYDGSTERIGYATSADGIKWDKFPKSVLDPTPGSWDELGVSNPSVLFDGNIFHMWYTGEGGTVTPAIGYATSTDGIAWDKNSKSVLDPTLGSWDGKGATQPSVVYNEPFYHMWYAGYDGSKYQICYASSINGITWTKHPIPIFNPILDPLFGDGWDNSNVFEPSVIYDGSKFHLWYVGNFGWNNRIGYATSNDGKTWTRYPKNPVLDIGPHSFWDDNHVTGISVIQKGSTYRMWYSGHDGNNFRIGYASSEDGSSWTKKESSPEVLDTYVVTNIIEPLTYTMELNVPSTVDLDMFIFCETGGRDDALASSTNTGAGIDESITFTAPISGEYILVITNEDIGTGMYTVCAKSTPIPKILGNLVADKNGMISFEADALYPGLIEDPKQYPAGPVDISADGSYLAIGWDSCITFFRTDSSIPLWTLDINEYVHELKLSDSGEHLVILSQQSVYFFDTSSSVPLWSVETGYSGSYQPGNRIDMDRNGRFVACKVWGDRALVFDTTSDTPTTPYWDYDFGDEILTTKLSGNGEYLALGGNHDHEFRLGWVPGKNIKWTHTGEDPIYSASISHDGSIISNGHGNQHNVSLFNSARSTPVWSYELEGRQFEQVMSDDGSYFISSNQNDGTLGSWSGFALWDIGDPVPIWEYHVSEDLDTWADAVDMDREAKYVVGGCSLNKVYLFSQLADGIPGWNNDDGDPVFTYTTGGEILYNRVSISADGNYFAAGSYDGSVYLFSTIGEPNLSWSWNPSYSAPALGEFSWDFDASVDLDGDGNFTTDEDFKGPDPTHIYEKDGNYTVTLKLTTEDGAVHIYTMFVEVDVQDSESWQEILLKPGLPLAAVAIIAALFLGLFGGSTEVGKYRLIPFISPLYSRLKKEEVLDHFTRGRIYEYIRRNPGDHYNNIKQELGLKNGSLAYHLRTLENEEFIKSKRDGIYKRFYLTGIEIPEKIESQLSPIEEDIIKMIKRNPGIIQKEISRALKLSQQLVSYHVNVMIHSGLIRAERHGKTFRYFYN